MLLLLLLLAGVATAQSAARNDDEREDWLHNPIPHPFLYLGPSLMGGGYAPLAYRAEGGIDVESTHFMLRALGAYDNGHKTDDGDQPNPKGHDRYLDSAVYYRLNSGRSRGLYFGGGYTWGQLSTTNYTKGGGRYQIGGGYDVFLRSCSECRRDFSMRVNMDWITAGQDWQNGSHGPQTTFTWPAPIEKRHWASPTSESFTASRMGDSRNVDSSALRVDQDRPVIARRSGQGAFSTPFPIK